MEHDFWHARWARDEIGFHQPDGNPLLAAHWDAVGAARDACVLVPLCGKTPDMAWLAARGHRVVGVEISDKAARAFFDERGLEPDRTRRDGFEVYSAGGITLWVGDIFALPAAVLADCDALYDRAALIALPPGTRERYADLLCRHLPDGCRGLLVTLAYDQNEMDGPPFSVPDSEVRALLTPAFGAEPLAAHDALADNERFRQKGLSALRETVWRLSSGA